MYRGLLSCQIALIVGSFLTPGTLSAGVMSLTLDIPSGTQNETNMETRIVADICLLFIKRLLMSEFYSAILSNI